MIEAVNLNKTYGRDVALDIDRLQISQAECFGLVGNNGAGKTTLFRLILDLIIATSGHVAINGKNVAESEEWKSDVGSYLDEHMLLPFLTPNEYFQTLGDIHSLTRRQLEDHLSAYADFFNGEILGKNKYIRDLSKGNIKKVGIAAAFISSPEIVILDEPFENLDPTSQNRLKKLIREDRTGKGTTFLISSHDLAHVTDICDRIVLLESGSVLKDLKDEKQVMADELKEYFDR